MNMAEGLLETPCKGWAIFSKAAAETNIILIMVLTYKADHSGRAF
jgi:hypothetical protein